jgi:integrase/recombinase XerD
MRAELKAFIINAQKTRQFSPNSIKTYYYDLKLLMHYLVAHKIYAWFDVTHFVLVEYLAELKKQSYKRNTLQHKSVCFQAFFEYLQKREAVSSNPAKRLIPGKQGRTKQSILTLAMIKKMIKTAQRIPKTGWRDALLIELLYSTKLRVEDLKGLTVEQIMNKEAQVMCHGGQMSKVVFSECAICCVKEYQNIQLKRGVKGKRIFNITERQMNNILKNVSSLAAMKIPATPLNLKNSYLVHHNN